MIEGMPKAPRANLQRILRFHPSLQNHALAVLICFLGIAVLSLVYALQSFIFQNSERMFLLSLISLGSSLVLAYGSYLFWRSLVQSKVRIENDHLLYESEKKHRLIFYRDVIDFDVQTLKFRTKGDSEFHFLPYIERPEYVLESLYRHNPALMSEVDFTRIRNEMVVWDHQQHRSGIFKNSLKALVLSVIPVALFALLLWWFDGQSWASPTTYGISGLLFLVSVASYYWIFNKEQRQIQTHKRLELQKSFLKTARDYATELKYSRWGFVTLMKVQGLFVVLALLFTVRN